MNNARQSKPPHASKTEGMSNRARLERQIQQVRNQIDFVEILCSFWPLPNMGVRRDRLEQQLANLSQIHEQLQEERREEKPRPTMEMSHAAAFNPTAFSQKMYPPQGFGTRFPVQSQGTQR